MPTNATLIDHQGVEDKQNEGSTILLPDFLSIQFLGVTRKPSLNFTVDIPSVLFMISSLLFELVANLCVLVWVKMKERKLVDTMVTADCITNLLCSLLIILAFPVRVYRKKLLCAGITLFRIFVICLKRLIPVTIIMYRYLMVCHASFCWNIGRKKLSRRLICLTFIIPVVISIVSLFFSDVLRDNLICNGREEVLWYNLDNFFADTVGSEGLLLLHFYHPFKFITHLLGYAYVFLVPIGYIRIYTFLKTQSQTIEGIPDEERYLRKKENVVTTGFNLAAWMVQVSADILVSPVFAFLYPNFFIRMLLLVLIGCGFSPLGYLIGANVKKFNLQTWCKFWKKSSQNYIFFSVAGVIWKNV